MEKEIKFKVLDNNKLFGYERLTNNNWEWMCIELNPDNGVRWIAGVMNYNDSTKRVQFINSTDKDGKEVYDGDILEAPSKEKFIVKWYDEEMRWAMFSKDTWYNMNMKLHKVVGSIFENTELIS